MIGKLTLIVFSQLIFYAAHSQTISNRYPKINDSVSNYLRISKPYRLIVSGSSGITVVDYQINGVKYAIADYFGKVIFIYSKDINFRTPEGITTSTTFSKIPAIDSTGNLAVKYQGFYRKKLKSGWVAFFETTENNEIVKFFILK